MGIFSKEDPTTAELQNLRAEFDDLTIAASERLGRMRQYRRENNSARDLDLSRGLGGFNFAGTDYGRNIKGRDEMPRHAIPLPFGKALTVKHAYRIAGELPDCVVDRRDETPQERHRSESMEKIVWAIMRASGGETSLASGAWDASEIGSACFDLYWDIGTEMPLFRRVDPAGVITVPGVDDPHDFQRVYRAWEVPTRSLQAQYAQNALFRGVQVDVRQITASGKHGDHDVTLVVQTSDKERSVRFAAGKDSVVGLHEYAHGYGFAPYIVIPNVGPYEDIWGWADYEFIRSLQGYLTALFSREADVLRGVANGAVIERATGQNPDEVKRVVRQGGVLPSKRDGTVEPIAAPEMPGFHESHSDRAMEMLKMISFAPDAAWGKPGSSSGTDRGLQLQPLMEYTAMKQLNWAAGMSRLFNMAYRMIEQKMVTSVTYRGSIPGATKGSKSQFAMLIGPGLPSEQEASDTESDPITQEPIVYDLPRSPRELFDGDYCARFLWNNRLDPDDPRYVTSEMAKFTSGAQSLQTTLERLGFQQPEAEMSRIEKEAKRFPWINQGMVALILQQLKGNDQGQGGGNPGATPSDLAGQALDSFNSQGGGDGHSADASSMMLPDASGPHGGYA